MGVEMIASVTDTLLFIVGAISAILALIGMFGSLDDPHRWRTSACMLLAAIILMRIVQ